MGGVADRFEHKQAAAAAVIERFQQNGSKYDGMSSGDLQTMLGMTEGRDRSGSRGEHIDQEREVLNEAIQAAVQREQSVA